MNLSGFRPIRNQLISLKIGIITRYLLLFAFSDGKTCKCQKEVLRSRKNILLRYIDGNKKLELHAAFALQNLAVDFNHPLSKYIFESFCESIFLRVG